MVVVSNSKALGSKVMAGPKQAESIPSINAEEASQIAAFELDQVLGLLEQLEGDDWAQPTDCTEWNIRDMTAHLAGACAGHATWKDFRRQAIFNPHIFKTIVTVDGINTRQLEDRVDKSPHELVDELREVGPKAVRTRKNLPGILRILHIPAKPMSGFMSIRYLVDVIYPRDQWMHRMDICRATRKTLVITPGHDDHLLDQVMRDVAKTLHGKLAIQVNITGALRASYRFGSGEPMAELDIDFLTFNRRASMRITADEALQGVTIYGDDTIAKSFLQNCPVLY
jgi:uncharacterized protein (TIGR03083 family)